MVEARKLKMVNDVRRFAGFRWFATEGQADDAVALMQISTPSAGRAPAFDGPDQFCVYIGGLKAQYTIGEPIALDPPTPVREVQGEEAAVEVLRELAADKGDAVLDILVVMTEPNRYLYAREFLGKLNVQI